VTKQTSHLTENQVVKQPNFEAVQSPRNTEKRQAHVVCWISASEFLKQKAWSESLLQRQRWRIGGRNETNTPLLTPHPQSRSVRQLCYVLREPETDKWAIPIWNTRTPAVHVQTNSCPKTLKSLLLYWR